MRLLLLSLAVTPYVGLVAIDAWMHEKARRVPIVEQWLHAAILIALGGFFLTAFLGANTYAGILLVLSLPLIAADEVGFHRHLSRRERRVHLAEGLALILFILVWSWTSFQH